MPKKISEDTKRTIQDLYSTGASVRSVSLQTGVPYATVYGYTRARERGFTSLQDYKAHLAREKGFKTLCEYNDLLAQRRGFLLLGAGFGTFSEYLEENAQEEGFSSHNEKRKALTLERQGKNPNKELSDLLSDRLEEVGQNQSWLAKQVGVCREMASRYVHGESIPKPRVLRKISRILEIPYSTFETILNSDYK